MSLVEELGPLVVRRLGLLPPHRALESDLAAIVEARRCALGLASDEAYVQRVLLAPDPELPHLSAAFTNGWTWFFRDHEPVLAIAESLRAMQLRRPAWIWVAGCSTGEDAYGAAIACAEVGLDARILGTDVDAARLEIARTGELTALSIRRVPESVLARYFVRSSPDRMRVSDALRARVELRVHNLLDPAPLPEGGAWDAILCRNVLLHCTEDAGAIIAARLRGSVARHGKVVFGPGDPLPPRRARDSDLAPPPRRAPSIPPAPRPATIRPPLALDHWSLALTALQRGAHAEARAALESLVAERPSHFEGHTTLGNLCVASHELERAAEAYRRAEALEPRSAELHFLWGALHRKRGAWSDAATALRRALFLDDDLWPAQFLLAGAWERLGAADRARHALERTLRSLDRRPSVQWRSCVDLIDAIACRPDAVRGACEQRLFRHRHERGD